MILLEDRSAVLHDAIWVNNVSIDAYKVENEDFVTYKIELVTINNASIEFWRRYSSFERLYDNIIRERSEEYLAVPNLPPKTGYRTLDNDIFLRLRMDSLEYFLKCVLLNPYTAGSEAVKWFIYKL